MFSTGLLQNGWTSLHFAAKAGYLHVVKYLVESGASTKHETKDGKVPICFAASFSHFDVLSYLMQRDHSTQRLLEDKKVYSVVQEKLLVSVYQCYQNNTTSRRKLQKVRV